MINYLQIPIEKYGTIKVEIEPTRNTSGFEELGVKDIEAKPESGFEDLGFKEKASKTIHAMTAESPKAFEKLMETMRAVSHGFIENINKMEVRPDEVSIEFGLAIKADVGVVVAKTGGDASFKVTLAWKTMSYQKEGE